MTDKNSDAAVETIALTEDDIAEYTGVRVAPDRTVTLEVQLLPTLDDSITVEDSTPTVDVTGTTSGATFGEEWIESLPLGRNFAAPKPSRCTRTR